MKQINVTGGAEIPHLSDVGTWTVQIRSALPEICTWIDAIGGPTSITSLNLYTLIQSFISQSPVPGYAFIPTSLEIYGCIQYWNGNISGGNQNAGCDY